MNALFKHKMDTFWIICYYLGIFLLIHSTSGQSEVMVQLLTKKYVEKGSTVILRCLHNIEPNILSRVAWLKNDADIEKFFEFVADRKPPFRNFTIPGAEVDWENSNSDQVALKNVDFEAAGLYYCEVTTSTPIYTKPSQDEQIHVYLPQTGPPRISYNNKRHYHVGDKLVANCSTTRSRPPPHITWLINGIKVDDRYVRQLHPYSSSGKNIHRSKTHQHQQQILTSPPVNKLDIIRKANLRTDIVGNRKVAEEINNFDNNFHHFYENHHRISDSNIYSNNYYNPSSQYSSSHEANHKIYDNKYFDTRKHRYVSENGGTSNAGSGNSNIMSSTSTGTGLSNSGPAARSYRGIMSFSQLHFEISEHHINRTGRLEITCLATIPAHISDGEEYADYKTYSIKVDVEKPEYVISSALPPMSGMAALGNTSFAISIYQCPVILSTLCLLLLKL